MAKPNERPAQPKDTSRPEPGASGKHGEPHEAVGREMAANNSLEGAQPGAVRMGPESRVRPGTAGVGSDSVQRGAAAAGGSVIDKRAPENKRDAARTDSPEAIADRLRDVDA